MVALLVAGALAYARIFIPRYRLSGSADDAILPYRRGVGPGGPAVRRTGAARPRRDAVDAAIRAGGNRPPRGAAKSGRPTRCWLASRSASPSRSSRISDCARCWSAVLRRGACATSGRRCGSNTGRPARSCWPISPARRCSFRCSFPTCCPNSPTSICRCGSICRPWSGESRRWSRCRSRCAGSAAIAGATPRYRSCCWSARGFVGAYLAQGKGWSYHAYPAAAFFLIAAGWAAQQAARDAKGWPRRLGALLLAAALILPAPRFVRADVSDPALAAAILRLAPHPRILAIAFALNFGHPLDPRHRRGLGRAHLGALGDWRRAAT